LREFAERIDGLYGELDREEDLPVFDLSGAQAHCWEGWMKKHVVLTAVDKATDRWAIVCRRQYLTWAFGHLDEGDTYLRIRSETVEQVIERLNGLVVNTGVVRPYDDHAERPKNPAPAHTPHLYLTPKLHKGPDKPVKFRPILGNPTTPMAPLASVVACGLQMVVAVFDEVWRDTMLVHAGVHVNRSTILTNSEELVQHLEFMNSQHGRKALDLALRYPCSSDFEGLYTNIPQGDLKRVIACMIRYAHAWMTHDKAEEDDTFDTTMPKSQRGKSGVVRLLLPMHKRKDKAWRWVKGDVPDAELEGYVLWSEDDFCGHVDTVIDMCYIVFGGELYKMEVGFPMGIACGPALADVYLLYYEFTFALRKFKEERETGEQMPRWMLDIIVYLKRYIDDVFLLTPTGDVPWKDILWDERSSGGSDGIYPTGLARNDGTIVDRPLGLDTDCVGPSIRFLDVEATLRLGRFVWRLYDKRNEMKIFEGMRKFPHPDAVLDSGVKSRVLVNEIGRFDRRTSSSRDLRAATLRHCQSFLDHGYSAGLVSRQVAGYPASRDMKGNWKESEDFIQRRLKKMRPNE